MSKKKVDEMEQTVEKLGGELKEAGRSVWLAGLGAFAEAEEQGKSLFETLVARGRTVQKEQQAMFEETFGDAGRRARRVGEWMTGTFEDMVDAAAKRATETLQRFGVPTYEDIRTLNERVAELNEKVESLSAR